MPEGIQEIDTAGAAEAIDSAGGIGNLIANQDQSTEQTQQTDQTTETTGTTEVGSPEHIREYLRDAGGRFTGAEGQTEDSFVDRADLDALLAGVNDPVARERIEKAYKSFQGGFTRRMQEFSEVQKSYEQLGDPEQLKQATQVYQQLQDPQNWPQLYEDIRGQLQQMGYNLEDASALAAEEVDSHAAQQGDTDPLAALAGDPEFAPIKQAFDSMKAEVKGMQDQLATQREQEQAEQLQMRIVGELNRQESSIRSQKNSNGTPRYNDDDVNDIYSLASYYDGNLFEAQRHFDESFARRLKGYMASKTVASGAPSMSSGQTISHQPVEAPRTFDEAAKLADEYVKQAELSGL